MLWQRADWRLHGSVGKMAGGKEKDKVEESKRPRGKTKWYPGSEEERAKSLMMGTHLLKA